MDQAAYDRLTPRQRDCLRLVARDRDAKEIARLLGISPETVVSHLKKAMRITGADTRFAAARQLAEIEGRPHPMVIPSDGGQTGPDTVDTPSSSTQSNKGAIAADAVCEDRAVFTVEPVRRAPPSSRKEQGDDAARLNRLLLIVSVATLIILILDRLVNLGDAFQTVANRIKPPH